MSEESENVTEGAVETPTNNAPAAPVVESNEPSAADTAEMSAQQAEHIIKMAETNPAIKDLPEYQNLMATVDKVRQEKPNENTSTTEANEPNDSDDVNDENEEVIEDDDNDVVEDNNDEDNPFGLNISKKSAKVPTFENEGDFKKHMEKKYAIKDYGKFLNSVDKWRNQSQKAVEVEQNYSQLIDGLGSLPQPIKDAIDAFANAQDYRTAFTSSAPSLDFSKEADDVEKETVVSHYFKAKLDKQKTKLDEGEIFQEEYDEYVEDLLDSAKRLFKSDKRDWERERADIIKREADTAEAVKNSAVSSVESLKQKFPNFSSNELKKVRTRLVQQDLNNLFFDKNGNYKADAAEKVALALYSDKLISALTNKAKADGESAANATTVQRGKKKIVAAKGNEGVNKTEASNAVGHLQGQFKKDPYS